MKICVYICIHKYLCFLSSQHISYNDRNINFVETVFQVIHCLKMKVRYAAAYSCSKIQHNQLV
jgi:hypothetical protein